MGAGAQSPRGLLRTLGSQLLVFDLVLAVFATGIMLSAAQSFAAATTAALCGGLLCARLLGWWLPLRDALRGVTNWAARGDACTDAELLDCDRALEKVTIPLSVLYAVTWILYLGGTPMLGHFVVPKIVLFGRGELVTMGFVMGAAAFAAPMVVYTIVGYYTAQLRVQLSKDLERRGLVLERPPSSLFLRFISMALALVLTPLSLLAGAAWHVELQSQRERAMHELQREGLSQREALPRNARVVEGDELPPGLSAQLAAHPDDARESIAVVDVVHERAHAAVALADGRWLLLEADVAFEQAKLWRMLGFSSGGVLVWASFVIYMMSRSLTDPIARLRGTIHRVVEVGDLQGIGRIPVVHGDELGLLTGDVNELLDGLRRLAATTQRVAAGELEVEVEGQGELVEAFRGMVTQLHEIIVEIRSLSLSVASAASEIQAAAREQELAGEHQDALMQDLRESMRSLAHSATQINASVTSVHDNAERTHGTTDEMAARLTDLDTHTRGVTELLDGIREVADRSDILALNGSLEATRAGEAGRGFALVAAEMRRLAERVTGTVVDVQRLVAEMANASAGTRTATSRSRDLAAATSDAAKSISDETARQTEATQRASDRVHQAAVVVGQISAALSQTRALAEDLEGRAAELERSTARFTLRRAELGGARP